MIDPQLPPVEMEGLDELRREIFSSRLDDESSLFHRAPEPRISDAIEQAKREIRKAFENASSVRATLN